MSAFGSIERYALVLVISAAFVGTFFISPQETLSQSSAPLTGYGWSDTTGWVSFNCSNLGTCGTSNYGLTIAANGTISGYAWSEHLGWISANSADLTGCPTAPCTARMDELAIKGWLKALSGGASQSGGWDGFISLSGTNYGPTLGDTGTFSGYAWGDINVGWLSFGAGTTPVRTTWLPACATQYVCTDGTHRQNSCQGSVPQACSSGQICSAGACVLPPEPSTSQGDELKITPSIVNVGGTALVTWAVDDATTCTVTENSTSVNDTWSGSSSADATGCTKSGNSCRTSPLTGTVTYTLSCTGPGGTLTQTATVTGNPQWREL